MLVIRDRSKDMILVSGFNVYPNEVEAILSTHKGVIEAAVIGVPDQRTGESVRAYVVVRDPPPPASELEKHCRASLAAYKIPREFIFRSDLPKSSVGKILRAELRRETSFFWGRARRTSDDLLCNRRLFGAAVILTRPLGTPVGDFLDRPLDHRGLAFSRPLASGVLTAAIPLWIALLPQRAGRHPEETGGVRSPPCRPRTQLWYRLLLARP